MNKCLEKDLVWVSASQIQTFDGCKRKWAGQKLFKLPEPARAAASMGSEVHEELELLAHAHISATKSFPEPQRHERLVHEMWKHVPTLVGAEIVPEARLELPVIPGVRLLGFADLLIRYPETKAGVVLDYKTTKSKRYVKSKKTLEAGDLQAVVYTQYGRKMFPDHRWTCHWITGLTDGSNKVTSATAFLTDETVDRVWNHVKEASEQIVQLRASKPQHFEEVEPTFGDACKAFGGCPFLDRCHQAAHKEVEDSMDNREALLARIRAAKASKAAVVEATPVVEVIPDLEGPTPEPEVDPINPPEAAKAVEKCAPDPVEEKPKATKKTKAKSKPKAPKAEPAVEADLVGADLRREAPVVESVVEEAPVGRVLKDVVEKAAPLLKEMQDLSYAPTTEPDRTLRLYVGCFPMRGEDDVVWLSDLVEGAARAVCDKADARHWSLAEYGTGKGGLVVEMEARMPRDCAVYIDPYTEEAKALLPLFERHAKSIVRG